MNTSTTVSKGCTPQLFPDERPGLDWPLERLKDFAKSQHQEILADEEALAVKYWRLGAALNLLRNNFNRGQWQQLLATLGIDKTRASRARAIARTFANETELAGLTVRQAYERRCRSRVSQPTASANSSEAISKLRRLLDRITKVANEFSEFEAIAEPHPLLPALDASIAELERLRDSLQTQ
ncbi:MAG: hypothetical protein QGG71_24200 [Pirellulaceae bacterium]|jgi:hypothetical protein|nr:hypothetical protein [Pirellulaceae bacterium]